MRLDNKAIRVGAARFTHKKTHFWLGWPDQASYLPWSAHWWKSWTWTVPWPWSPCTRSKWSSTPYLNFDDKFTQNKFKFLSRPKKWLQFFVDLLILRERQFLPTPAWPTTQERRRKSITPQMLRRHRTKTPWIQPNLVAPSPSFCPKFSCVCVGWNNNICNVRNNFFFHLNSWTYFYMGFWEGFKSTLSRFNWFWSLKKSVYSSKIQFQRFYLT